MSSHHLSRFAGETLLITDDEQVIVNLARLLLEKYGFTILTAADGQACLDQVERHRPALVLLDYMLPLLNGLDVLRRINQDYPDTYVMMFTGRGSEEVAVEAMKAGAADYLQKPFNNQSLKERVDSVLSRRQIELENRRLLQERELLQQEIQAWNKELEERVQSKSLELEQAHEEILQAEKLAALGHMSAGMAHEIRNPLNSISLFAEILLSCGIQDEENRSYVKKIIAEVERIDQILLKMRGPYTRSKQQPEAVDLAEIVDRVLYQCRSRITAQQVDVKCHYAKQLPTLLAAPGELEQVFSNLLGNALHEMPDGGSLEIGLQAEGESIAVSIADTGPGIPQQHAARIFDPFFTTKERGTGFGLSVARRIVDSYGGRIWLDQQVPGGACFRLSFPLFAQQRDAGHGPATA